MWQIGTLAVLLFVGNVNSIRTEYDLKADIVARASQWAHRSGIDSITVEFRRFQIPKTNVQGTEVFRVVDDGCVFRKGRVIVPVEIVRENITVARFSIPVVLRTYQFVYVAQRQIQRGERFTHQNCRLMLFETTYLPADVVTEYAELETLIAARILSEKSVVTRSVSKPIPIVNPYDIVTLKVRAGTVMISTPAIAKEEGYRGKHITVQRVDTHQKYRARVLDAHTVELEIY
ncbi:MAG: flagellar basal body P-ring formation chaperone FlgA [Bacteroidetes bacterium]|nr:flagellar basal body P-ring formation chaperone FlgA [Bacteroidota bacterium]